MYFKQIFENVINETRLKKIDSNEPLHIDVLKTLIDYIYILHTPKLKKYMNRTKKELDDFIKNINLNKENVYNFFGNYKDKSIIDKLPEFLTQLDDKKKEIELKRKDKYKLSDETVKKNNKLANENYQKIINHLENENNYIQITTFTKSIIFDKKHIDFFKVKNSKIYFRSGKNWFIIYENGKWKNKITFGKY